ncbi:hypothetical protein COW36_11265 [bacterium (Candidatus Blackallbacteria) CG17_big_fil_post_rev_8_21_14_2_50_48_46]|uniref:Uncharacterized protein n=1 Tax=bacterium (Candidatus Blackallbacteria) CG17_big_fil_post_rev_8_21_14_2_50_48_46 TaxID=2014261 RepID=A0A2M7G5K2_9BACT|nr:MAG: hypothetical protein COW64_18360 [bacterium (Candidatus Blackallbacteria) CG18_big_fil_WC_8_21_14_2_50_49_26]PIW16854.1 MAG: hypothetical protein COW36_11265 [bacterium (Candidatus Blackallbacteria) CG17_big_fil_post_rev_8_21_14_2_50_48_46]PIW48051.1 MAG: hypothetical protein COW20_10980 [bacterium (Candidatus Blackallbacteria) CG13_big_fil_rev_8_21_14_2_50_49_14]
MSVLSISRLESQLLQQVELARAEGQASPSLSPVQKQMVQYAFQDFVNFFLQLEYLADAMRRQKQSQLASGPSLVGTQALSTTDLHLKIQVSSAYETPATQSRPQQPVTVQKYADEASRGSLIQIYTPFTNAEGVTAYQVTSIQLALRLDALSQNPSLAETTQTGQIPLAAASGSAGQGLDQFFKATDTQAEAPFWAYENQNAMELLEEEQRLEDWQAQQDLQAMIEAAYQVMAYLHAPELQAAFGMNEEEKEMMMNALQNDPADVAQAVLKTFIRKRCMELEMLRKELKDKQDLEDAKHKIEKVPPQFERILNFFDTTQRLLETQKIDKNALRSLMDAIDKLNQSLNQNLVMSPMA